MSMISLDKFWSPAPANLVLSRDEVHVWCASLDQSASLVQQLATTLSADEQLRADRFRFEQHRQHFIIGRGVLRAILGRYMNIEPSQLQFCYSPHGKPALADADTTGMLQFNLSHSGGVALYAVACERQIGIDIERLRPFSELEQIAKRFFSNREYEELRALSPSQQHDAFFRYWTLKEAYVKATGQGLSLALNQFEVSLASRESAVVLKTPVDSQEASHWSLKELSPGHGYVAAIAVEGDSWQIKCWQW